MGLTTLLSNSQDRLYGAYPFINTIMDIKELESFRLADAVKFHDELNPKLWIGDDLDPVVYDKLMAMAEDFITELGIGKLKVEDITISGSNAAYSYTPHSDIDLHILVDIDKLPNDEVYRELFNAKKNEYNRTHDLSIRGIPVELYVQDSEQPHASLGEYSLLKKDWIKFPVKRRANFDQERTRAKYEKLGELIELALKNRNLADIERVLDIVKRYRKAGLTKTGEFGPENLAFKAIRKHGLFQALWDMKQELHSERLSLANEMGEDYDPNGPPPGPEFPPTMPKGTIRVDVSDVYDWYKLGQHISNMKGLGKHDFGKGPPSTILSFGDEDLEHKYIDALKKTGLDTTDIDPKAHDTKKGQKVDPTYNVGVAEGSNNIPQSVRILTYMKDILDQFIKQRGAFGGNRLQDQLVPLLNQLNAEGDKELALSIMQMIRDAEMEDRRTKGMSWGVMASGLSKHLPNLIQTRLKQGVSEASGYIPSEKEKNDPRFKTALTVDVKPDSIKKNAKAFGWSVSRSGRPPLLR